MCVGLVPPVWCNGSVGAESIEQHFGWHRNRSSQRRSSVLEHVSSFRSTRTSPELRRGDLNVTKLSSDWHYLNESTLRQQGGSCQKISIAISTCRHHHRAQQLSSTRPSFRAHFFRVFSFLFRVIRWLAQHMLSKLQRNSLDVPALHHRDNRAPVISS